MVAEVRGFQRVVEEAEDPQVQATRPADKVSQQSAQMFALALQALSQRAIAALGNLFTAATVLSAFWLWNSAPADPTVHQLIGLGLYGAFILALHMIRGR